MPLIIFDDIETEDSAACEQFGFDPQNDVFVMTKSLPEGHKPLPKGNIVVLGHSGEQIHDQILWKSSQLTVGGFTPSEMADYFDLKIPAGERSSIGDIYLVSCEAGWSVSKDKPCFARQFAAIMHNRGYTSIKIHAITSPEDLPEEYTGMRVELITNPGVKSSRQGIRSGHAGAFLCTREFDELSEKLKQLQELPGGRTDVSVLREIQRVKEQLKEAKEAHYITDAVVGTLLDEMNRPENMFTVPHSLRKSKKVKPDQVANQPKSLGADTSFAFTTRVLREFTSSSVASSSTPQKDATYDQVTEFLEQRKARLKPNKKRHVKLMENIDALLENMANRNSLDGNWRKVILDARKEYKGNSGSSFGKLLVKLIKKFEINESVAVKPDRKQKKSRRKHPKTSVSVSVSEKILNPASEASESRVSSGNVIESPLPGNAPLPLGSGTAALLEAAKSLVASSMSPDPDMPTQHQRTEPSTPYKEPEQARDERVSSQEKDGAVGSTFNPHNPSKAEETISTSRPNIDRYYRYHDRKHFLRYFGGVQISQNQRRQFSPNLRNLTGDALKRGILIEFKEKIDAIVTTNPQQFTDRINQLRREPGYAILEQSQGFIQGRFFSFTETDSVRAFNAMVEERRQDLFSEAGPKPKR